MRNRKRLQLDISEEACRRLETLQVETDSSSQAEVVRRALSVFDTLVKAVKGGKKIILRDGDGEQEVLIV